MKSKVNIWIKSNIFKLLLLISTLAIFIYAVFIVTSNFQNLVSNISNGFLYVSLVIICILPIAFSLYRLFRSKTSASLSYNFSEIMLKSMATIAVVFAYYIFVALFIVLPAIL